MKLGDKVYTVVGIEHGNVIATADVYTLEQAREKAEGYTNYHAAHGYYGGSKRRVVYVAAEITILDDEVSAASNSLRKAEIEVELERARERQLEADSDLRHAREKLEESMREIKALEAELDG